MKEYSVISNDTLSEDPGKRVSRLVFFKAFIVRLGCLLLIIVLSPVIGTEFDKNASNPDDRRYEAAAEIYSDTANGIIDVDAFANACLAVDDPTGLRYTDWFLSTPLWYWISFILVYIFKTHWVIRFLNILISSVTVVYLYKYCMIIGDKNLARKSSNLMTFLPSPLIFPCFAYKDQLVMFCFMYLIYWSSYFRKKGFKGVLETKSDFAKRIIAAALFAFMLMSLRSGISSLFLIVILLNVFKFDELVKSKRIRISTIILALIGIGVSAYIIMHSFSTLSYKLLYYFNRHTVDLGESIRVLAITNFRDIYKLPATFLFALVMPIKLFASPDSWYNITAGLNLITVPIAVGTAMYLFQKQKKDSFLYWGIVLLFLVSIIASLSNFRHYYSLLPVLYVGYAEFRLRPKGLAYQLWLIGTVGFAALLIVYYLVT